MPFNFFKQTTAGGYELGEVTSALQKSIRRNLESAAMFWAIEIESIQPTYLWNRLKIIASEDVGLADPMACVVIATLEQNYTDAKKRGSSSTVMFLSHAILHLARANKSRLVDWFLLHAYRDPDKLEVPDFALDGHTARGKRLGRGPEYFLSESTRLEPHTALHDEEHFKKLAAPLMNAPDRNPKLEKVKPNSKKSTSSRDSEPSQDQQGELETHESVV